jgi:hypothetical protein
MLLFVKRGLPSPQWMNVNLNLRGYIRRELAQDDFCLG